MLNALFGFLAAIKNEILAILAQFPNSSATLLSVAAILISKLGFNVTPTELAAIIAAVVSLVHLLSHHATVAAKAAAKEAEAAK